MLTGRKMPRLLAFGLAAGVAACAAWADEPERPGAFSVRFGGEASGTLGSEDQGFFNDVAYRRNALRLFRLSLLGELRAGRHLALLGELRSENLDGPQAYGLYLRVRPLPERPLDIQIGRIPPVFGAFARRRYGQDNPLIGAPLAYQYLTTVRPDAIPANADEMLAERGEGWLTRYSVGAPNADAGLPVVESMRWDTGVELRIGERPVEWSVAVTRGTLGNPRLSDDNGSKQLSTRLAWHPLPGFDLGGSFAEGGYLDAGLEPLVPRRSYRQRAFGVDAEYSWGRFLVRGEAITGHWQMPTLDAPRIEVPLEVFALFVEGRCRLAPGLHVAGRVDRLGFGLLSGSGGTKSWDARVIRVEGGLGYSLRRQLQLKASYQYNWRAGGFVHEQGLLAGQVLLWF
jgi:hypothetical protein